MSELWKNLHITAIKNNGNNEHIFLQKFGREIPRYTKGCSCNEFWNKWIRDNPPVYGPNCEFFAWTVKTHNAVNTKLGKPVMSITDALTLYSPFKTDTNKSN